MIVTCKACGATNEFSQPYPYHAGFGDTVFLYNEAGNCTLTWGTYDGRYTAIIGQADPWHPSVTQQNEIEARLPPSPMGDRWSFTAPARCNVCRTPIAQPMVEGDIYYFEYPDSVILGRAGLPSTLSAILDSRSST